MKQYQDSRPYIRKIEFVFYHEAEIRQAVADAREDAMEISPRNGSGVPDPTAYEAVRNLSPIPFVIIESEKLEHPELWLTVVDKTYAWCQRQEGLHYEIARRRYGGEFYSTTCRELSVSQTTFSATLEKIRMYAALQAAQFGLIYVD